MNTVPGADNTPAAEGNSAPTTPAAGGENNTGQEFDATQFWVNPDGGAAPVESGPDPRAFGEEIAGHITGFAIPDVFTPEVSEAIANGDMAGANQAFASASRQVMQQAVILSTRVVKHAMANLEARFDQRIAERMGSDKSLTQLEQSFPSMNDPAMRPVVEGVFKQAMTHTKGDTKAAIDMTRNMLKAMGKGGGTDFGIPDPTETESTGSSRSLVESLLSMN